MAKIEKKIKQKLDLLPKSPGVYLMQDKSGKIIYIGKAKQLKNRVRSYFGGSTTDSKTKELVQKINDFDYIITKTENQALELEANLIKKHRPKYNIALKDDKRYPFIKVTLQEDFPRIFVTRKLKKDGAKYFGPYMKASSVRRTLKLMEWVFPIRTCKLEINANDIKEDRACINFQLGKCKAPCIGNIAQEDYRKIVDKAMLFLKGKNNEIIEDLQCQMKDKSSTMDYEKAAEIRDKIRHLRKINNNTNLFFTDQKDRDIIGIYKENDRAAVSVLKVLSGKLLNKQIYALDNVKDHGKQKLIAEFLKQYYINKLDNLPYSIFSQVEPRDYDSINDFLKNKLHIPKRGEKKVLITIAKENAFNYVEEQKLKHLRKKNRTIFPIKELKDKLGLIKLPRKIVCLDISTIQGSDTVSSLVYFENGKPKKKEYRNYIIKTVNGLDDFASMKETLQRYITKLEDNDKPDLIVIDGGKGQLNSAFKVLSASTIKDIEMISLAKRMEEVFLPKKKHSIIMPRSSSALRLLIKVRDEAHRFAINFHRKKRSGRILKSDLDKVKGIGETAKFLLLKKFGSIKSIKKASMLELIQVKGIGQKTAQKILKELN